MTRVLVAVAAVAVCTGCTPDQLGWWDQAARDDQDAAMVHILDAAAARYGVDADLIVRIARCESGLNPLAKNPTSGAAGLGQHLPQFWPARAAAVGLDGASPFDPEANAEVTAWMLATQGTAPWASSRACWRR